MQETIYPAPRPQAEGDDAQPQHGHLDCAEPLVNPIRFGSGLFVSGEGDEAMPGDVRFRDIKLAHQLDIAWIIALYIAIHDGDPPPTPIRVDEGSAVLIDALASHLEHAGELSGGAQTLEAFQKRMGELGVEVEWRAEEAHASGGGSVATESRLPREICFTWAGRTICVILGPVRIPYKVADDHADS
jgi:hypothetical protein